MTTFIVPDMTCGHCKAAIETAVKSADPQAAITIDLAARTVAVQSVSTDAALIAAMQAEGYPAQVKA